MPSRRAFTVNNLKGGCRVTNLNIGAVEGLKRRSLLSAAPPKNGPLRHHTLLPLLRKLVRQRSILRKKQILNPVTPAEGINRVGSKNKLKARVPAPQKGGIQTPLNHGGNPPTRKARIRVGAPLNLVLESAWTSE